MLAICVPESNFDNVFHTGRTFLFNFGSTGVYLAVHASGVIYPLCTKHLRTRS